MCSCNPDPPQPLLVTAGFLPCLFHLLHQPQCSSCSHHAHNAHHAHPPAPHAAHHAALDNVDEEKNDAGGEAVRGR